MSRTTRVAILVQVLAGLLVVGACATPGSQPPADVPTPSGARGDGDAVAPAAFVDREPLDPCGDFRFDQEWAHLLCPDATSAAAPGTCQEA